MCTCFLYWGVYPLALRTWIWEVAFWTVTKCDSHKLRQFRNPCRRILWFVAFCDHGRDGTNWVQKHWKRVLGTWESTHDHVWHENEKFNFCPLWCYFTGIYFMCMSISYKLIIDVPRKPSWKGPILMWTCFRHLGVHPRLLWNLSEQLCFEPSQIATVTNCDNSRILAVAICDLSQFVIKAVTAQTESNNI